MTWRLSFAQNSNTVTLSMVDGEEILREEQDAADKESLEECHVCWISSIHRTALHVGR
jgi:hypothetical protein